ncbi:hypothetical protein [Pseudomonas aeruginosa]|uniref:hypothetical protein n=1 Tax=Pseudomonas aeruginosa TaxID=287 RepID=UPI001CBE8C3C|nr:hypothetical protein [Pseudomonas aeruginosa]
MSEVKRYINCVIGMTGVEMVRATDYAKLAAEAKALREEVAALKHSQQVLIGSRNAHRDERDAARKEVAELRMDKARLDRLDQLNVALNAKYGTTYQWQVIVNHNINRLMLGHLQIDLNDSAAFGLPSCRDALDTIMPGALLNQDKEDGNG